MIYLRWKDEWTYEDGALTLKLKPREVQICLCTQREPRPGCFFISRLEDDAWQVAPVLHTMTRPRHNTTVAYDGDGIHKVFIHLRGAPTHINEQLAEL